MVFTVISPSGEKTKKQTYKTQKLLSPAFICIKWTENLSWSRCDWPRTRPATRTMSVLCLNQFDRPSSIFQYHPRSLSDNDDE